MTCHPNDTLAKIFECLSNSKRRQILFTLNETSNKFFANSLQNNLLIKKHLKKLEDLGLIKQDPIGTYRLTAIGGVVAECSKGFEFLEKNKDFFADHAFGDISQSLLKNIGNLVNSQFFYGMHLMFSRWSKIVSESQEFVNCTFSQPPILIANYLGPKIHSGLKIHLLFDKRSKIPDCNEFVKNLDLRERITNENVCIRMAENSKINLVMSEKQACIFFPDNEGFADLNGNFLSSDPEFVSWCKEFFEYKWNDAESMYKLR